MMVKLSVYRNKTPLEFVQWPMKVMRNEHFPVRNETLNAKFNSMRESNITVPRTSGFSLYIGTINITGAMHLLPDEFTGSINHTFVMLRNDFHNDYDPIKNKVQLTETLNEQLLN